jgi:hypothetical protein
MLRIVDTKMAGQAVGLVILASENVSELLDRPARDLASQAGLRLGFSSCGVEPSRGGCYRRTKDGRACETMEDMEQLRMEQLKDGGPEVWYRDFYVRPTMAQIPAVAYGK